MATMLQAVKERAEAMLARPLTLTEMHAALRAAQLDILLLVAQLEAVMPPVDRTRAPISKDAPGKS